jgi:uncharacterized protein YdiU (UPF0061 family)
LLKKPLESTNLYAKLDCLNGEHPWMQAMPEGFVAYRVRELSSGKVVYFNFVLAKEMGLIPFDHPHQINKQLEEGLLKNFSLQIINEFDELSKRKIPLNKIKPNKYMATRYLQLQHASKKGATSGDGRGVWNGVIESKGKIWDVSSRGTGVTCLSPGAVEASKPLQTGSTDYGYGCGQAEIDELLSAAIMAEAIHLQGIATERVLCVIDHGKGVGIGVRAAHNLMRPAHLFLYLKQNRLQELQAAVDYFINRQIKNSAWQFVYKDNRKYDELAEKLCCSFADFAAQLDTDYIFAWLDWDGDNVLADAGIIDYGSVRQFGLRHDKYRFDDVDRFSTNLNEQRQKARSLVQTFAQMCNALKNNKKLPLQNFSRSVLLKKFDARFENTRANRLLYRIGFSKTQRELILSKHLSLFKEFDAVFSFFERAKVSGNPIKVSDGINHPALFNLRDILKLLPSYYQKSTLMPAEEFFKSILSSYAKKRDAQLRPKHVEKIKKFQELYLALLYACAPKGSSAFQKNLVAMQARCEKLNSDQRITGNALIQIVDEMMLRLKKGLHPDQIQSIVDHLIAKNLGYPEVTLSKHFQNLSQSQVKRDLMVKLLNIVHDNREAI